MARGYKIEEIKQKLVEVLKDSKTGLSGVEIAEKLGINRVTMSKYLKIFAAEGLIREKNIGNLSLWFVEEGTEQFQFPADYFKVKSKYQDLLQVVSEQQLYSLIRNIIHSGATGSKIMTEIIVPAIDSVEDLYQDGKISKSTQKLLGQIISSSIQIINLRAVEINPNKNVIIIAADSKSVLYADAASASFHSDGWKVFSLGDMSDAIDVLFDLDLQKFLSKIWKQKTGIMVFVVFSSTEEGLKFFSQSVNSLKGKLEKKIYLVLCSKIKKTTVKADLITENLDGALQWSQTIYERSIS